MSDRSLHHLATEKTTTLAAFGNIFGIGEHKRDTFGKQFIEVIKEYAPAEEELPFPEVAPETDTTERPATRMSETTRKTYELLAKGLNPQQVAEKRKLTETTIYDHIAELIEKGVLKVSNFVSQTSYRHTYRTNGHG
ncbi:MAG: helix-turn-helix domain-containing protein [Prevotella sp.]|nr:helix-turn-helix domain-containing protein [Prevotella sp.]MBQ8457876.1 helix-turn-helix domain-containing protein [Prevotella sp.]